MFQIFFEILFCKVIFTNDFTIKKIYIMTSFNESPLNSVKTFNGQLALRREFRGICYLEDLFSLLQLCLYIYIPDI